MHNKHGFSGGVGRAFGSYRTAENNGLVMVIKIINLAISYENTDEAKAY